MSGVVGRADLLAAFFTLLAFQAADRYAFKNKHYFYSWRILKNFSLNYDTQYSVYSCFRCFTNVMLITVYSLMALLCKETGVVVLPIIVAYRLASSETSSGLLYCIKDTSRTLFKYFTLVSNS